MNSKTFQPLRIPVFRRLGAAYAINDIGDMAGSIALAILIYDRTHNAFTTAGLFICAKFLPALIVPAIVAHVERLPTAKTLAIMHLLQMLFYCALALLVGMFLLPLILAIGFLDGTLALTARALLRGSLANELEPKGLLKQGNALLNICFAFSTAIGPAFAGGLIAWQGVEAALLLDAGSFGLIALGFFLSPAITAGKENYVPWRERLTHGFKWLQQASDLRILVIAQAVALIFFASVVPIEVVFAKQTLHSGNAGFGALLSAWGVGIIAGSILFTLIHRARMMLLVALSTVALGVSYIGQALSPTIVVACVFAVVGGLGNGVQTVSVLTMIQSRTPDKLMVRVSGLFECLGAAMPGIGFLIGGALATIFSPRLSFAVAGFGVLAIVALTAVLLKRPVDRIYAGVNGEAEASDPDASTSSETKDQLELISR